MSYITNKAGITLDGGFKLDSAQPLDVRFVIASGEDKDELLASSCYAGMEVWDSNDNKKYRAVPKTGGFEWKEVGTISDIPDVDFTGYATEEWVTTNHYTKTQVDNLIAPAMVMKGTLGTGGTETALPVANKTSLGDMYKVITEADYVTVGTTKVHAKVGDVFVCYTTDNTNYQWTLIPAGDSDTDTWREIKVNDTSILGNGITTNPLNLKAGTNMTLTNSNGTVTFTAVDTGATSVAETGSGNAFTKAEYDETNRKLTFTKGNTFVDLTSTQTISGAKTFSTDVSIYAASGATPKLVFLRGTATDSYNDWAVYGTGGSLYFDNRGSGGSWSNRIQFLQDGGLVLFNNGQLKKYTGDGNSTAYTYTLPNKTGTIALTSDIPADYVTINLTDSDSTKSGTLTDAQVALMNANPHKVVFIWAKYYCFAENLTSDSVWYYSANPTFNGNKVNKKVIAITKSSKTWKYEDYTFTDHNDNTTYTFTGGTNKFTVTPSSGSAYDVTITPSITNGVTGSGLTADKIVVGNGNSTIKTSSKGISTTLTSTDDNNVPTSKAIATYIAGLGFSGDQDLSSYISTTKNSVNVVGNTKDLYKVNKTALFVPNGLVMGGTAAAAGLVTRGICGASTPNETTGAASKDNLYLNYDGNDTWAAGSGRGVVINAGSVGTDLGKGMYSYCAVRGDIVKAWVEDKGYTTNTGTITSISMTVPTGLKVTGTPITTSGTLAVALDTGYTIPLATDVQKGVTAESWGNHANAGYLTKTEAESTYVKISVADSKYVLTANVDPAGNAASGKIVSRAAKGQINSEKFAVTNASGTVGATMEYDASYKAIKFVFV